MTPASCDEREPLTFMTFGDGDFTYSLDMAKHLASSDEARPCHVVATGIDTLDELNTKYRDVPFILKQLDSMNQSDNSVLVTVFHGVNAVQPPPSTEANKWKAHHVIFNHLHIGTENAALHRRFLSHFLHTASLHWMRADGGVLHLTLVKGQYERWHCEQAAKRHGLVLLERNPFVPPPGGGHYQHRRHQTGKSFASRAIGGSETFTFGRQQDEGKYVATRLPWHESAHVESIEEYPCPHCDKTFREERSRKSHVEAVHSHDATNKRKRVEALPCLQCKELDIVRVFPHDQALQDHIRAKHTSLHSNIKPDWAKKNVESSRVDDKMNVDDSPEDSDREATADAHGSCSVCGLVYKTEKDENNHLTEFIPRPVSELDLQDAAVVYQCSFCEKTFRDRRAQRQHENACFQKSPRNRSSNSHEK